MKPQNTLLKIIIVLAFVSCNSQVATKSSNSVIAQGQMPNLATDNDGTIYLAFGNGDSVLYSYSSDKGQSFLNPH